MSKSPVLRMRGITRTYRQGGNTLKILNKADLDLMPGETAALLGPSGCGKSTLLHIAGLLDRPDSGTISINRKRVSDKNDRIRTQTRRESVGFVYQYHHLLPELSALENVMLPLRINGERKQGAVDLLSRLGLEDRLHHRPGQLSGGEQQRVAIARALVHRPKLILADEPTGNLDPQTADNVLKLLLELVEVQQATLLIVTHDNRIAKKTDHILTLKDGKIQ